jgi:hypothetical protein
VRDDDEQDGNSAEPVERTDVVVFSRGCGGWEKRRRLSGGLLR